MPQLANIVLPEKLEPKISDPILSNYKLKKTERMETTANATSTFDRKKARISV